mmetsp:Transcript_8206/g.20773  ORF Transcript_8206/g.20773 Transcript_8206/m.20773 type:complete len:233 (-) Transcript_8206:1299-1997(-)
MPSNAARRHCSTMSAAVSSRLLGVPSIVEKGASEHPSPRPSTPSAHGWDPSSSTGARLGGRSRAPPSWFSISSSLIFSNTANRHCSTMSAAMSSRLRGVPSTIADFASSEHNSPRADSKSHIGNSCLPLACRADEPEAKRLLETSMQSWPSSTWSRQKAARAASRHSLTTFATESSMPFGVPSAVDNGVSSTSCSMTLRTSSTAISFKLESLNAFDSCRSTISSAMPKSSRV